MFKLTALAFVALGIAVGCSSSTPYTARALPNSAPNSTAASLAVSMLPSVTVPEELTLTAAVSKTCRCANGWQFPLYPSCTQPRCANLCLHGQGNPGWCI